MDQTSVRASIDLIEISGGLPEASNHVTRVRVRGVTETARRRKRTVITKVHEYGKLFGVHVALFIYHNGRYTTYRSINKRNWPPSMKKW